MRIARKLLWMGFLILVLVVYWNAELDFIYRAF